MKKFLLLSILMFSACSVAHDAGVGDINENVEVSDEGYVSEEFDFRIDYPEGHEVLFEYEGGLGFESRRQYQVPKEDIDEEDENPQLVYFVTYSVLPGENFGYVDSADYIVNEYPGYDIETYGDGYLVEGAEGKKAFRSFFLVDGDDFYEVSMRVPSKYFSVHEGDFMTFLNSFNLL